MIDEHPVLTDDEVVAVAVHLGGAWPTPLPSVEETEPALLSAALRGRRSLLVRDLAHVEDSGQGVLDPSVRECGEAVLDEPLLLAIYNGLSDLSIAPGGLRCYQFGAPGAERWMSEAVSGDGVHVFGWLEASAVVENTIALVDGVLADGLTSVDQDDAVLVVVRPGDIPLAVLADKASLTVVAALRENGEVRSETVASPATAAEALALLGFSTSSKPAESARD